MNEAESEPDEHLCEPGSFYYFCPTVNEVESSCHSGFDVCCDQPELHQLIVKVSQ